MQGIQDFIFRTGKLREIVGASELVEDICTKAFDEFRKEGEDVVKAAGNIKYIFFSKDACSRAALCFPKKVMGMAPGITISQAVVELSDDYTDDEFSNAIDEVEAKLKVQRNKPQKSVTLGLMGIKRANNTGLPVVEVKKKKDGVIYLDAATSAKLSKSEFQTLCWKSFKKIEGQLAYDISDITGQNDWIAIIHADGNGLGQVVQKVGKKKAKFREFSRLLDEATVEAANIAYDKAIKGKVGLNGVIPARPVVLSGDDMTIIIRGDLAIQYAEAFIRAFEEKTGEKLGAILSEFGVFEEGKNCLTACAGIAFIKSSYPFYYGYQLAEDLCSQAKKDTKAIAKEGKPQKRTGKDGKPEILNYLPSSCLMFHKVQDSFITSYADIVRRELTSKEKDHKLSFMAGPYYVNPIPVAGKHTVQELIDNSKALEGDHGEGVKSGIRNWISLRLSNKDMAEQRKNRMQQVFYKTYSDKEAEEDNAIARLTRETRTEFAGTETTTCMAFDVLAFNTVMNQQTNE